MRFSTRHSVTGSTLIEAMMAAGISAIFLSSLFAINTASMSTIKMAREAAAASQVLQQRVESMRIANWHQITDPDWVKANLLNTSAPGTSDLKAVTETLIIAPYGSANTADTMITRTGTSVVINRRNDTLLTENAIKVTWTVRYTGAPNDRVTIRPTVAILAKGGVAK
jgi:type II secretory pathway pseudopilin PulG